MKNLILAICFICLFVSAAFSQDNASLISQADLLYSSREVVSNAEGALNIYAQALASDPTNYEAAWKASQVCKYLGDKYPSDSKLPILESGEAYARKAIAIDPDRAEGHFWLGVSLGRIGEERGVLNSLFLVGPIKDEMEAVLKINPKHDGAHHVLAVLYRKAPGWPLSSGDINKAKEEALLSVQYGPQRTLNHLGLAEVYMSMDKNKDAKQELLMVIDMPLEPDRVPEDKDDKAQAKALLDEVNKKLGE